MSVQIFDLTHTFEPFMPQWPSGCNLKMEVKRFHANDGMYNIQWEGIMHRGTHMDAPLHVAECTPDITQYPLWRFFGSGVCLDIPKGKWGKITPEDLENAEPQIRPGDIVMINTRQHHIWSDSDDYFAYGCGALGSTADWLIERNVKMVGYGCQANDHPMATKLVDHGLGPTRPDLIEEWKQEYGRDPLIDFPLWEDGHKNLMVKGGIPGVENVGDDVGEGGDFDQIIGKRCFFAAFPWRFVNGEGSGVRVLAITDPERTFRFETGR